MRTETKIITYKTFSELSDDEKKKRIESMRNNESFMQIFYDCMGECYDEEINEIFKEINDTAFLLGERKGLSWQSSSQGWYFQHASFIFAYADFTKGIYKMDFDKVDLMYIRTAEELINNADYYKNDEYIDFNDVKNKKAVEYFKKTAQKIISKRNEFMNKISSAIYDYDTYYPSDEEISDYLNENTYEFITDEKTVA